MKEIKALQDWLRNDGYKDIKKQDAILLLKTLAHKLPSQSHHLVTVNRSVLLRSLHRNIACRPFPYYCEWLPMQEKVAQAARYLGKDYQLVRQLAYCMAACYDVAMQQQFEFLLEEQQILAEDNKFGFANLFFHDEGNKYNDGYNSDKNEFILRIAKINALFEKERIGKSQIIPAVLNLMRLRGDYSRYKMLLKEPGLQGDLPNTLYLLLHDKEKQKFNFYNYLAYCNCLLEKQFDNQSLELDDKILQQYSDKFRRQYGLITPEDTEEWLNEQDLDFKSYEILIASLAKLHVFVLGNKLHVLGITEHCEDIYWLLDALRLTGLYEQARKLLDDSAGLKKLQEEQAGIQNNNLEQYAFTHDFLGGERDFMHFIQSE